MVSGIMADLRATCKKSLVVGFGVCMGVGFCVCHVESRCQDFWICSHSWSAGPLYLKKQLIFVRNIHNSSRALHIDNKIFVKRPHQIPHA